MPNFNDGLFGSFKAANEIGVSLERLRYWENLGIVKPLYVQCGIRKFRRYSARDIQRAVLVKMLVDIERYTLAGALRKLETEGEDKI